MLQKGPIPRKLNPRKPFWRHFREHFIPSKYTRYTVYWLRGVINTHFNKWYSSLFSLLANTHLNITIFIRYCVTGQNKRLGSRPPAQREVGDARLGLGLVNCLSLSSSGILISCMTSSCERDILHCLQSVVYLTQHSSSLIITWVKYVTWHCFCTVIGPYRFSVSK